MRIARRIQQVRVEHSLSLEDLAAKVGLGEGRLARFESGEEVPSLETLEKLAEALGVPVWRLFYDGMDSNLTPWLTPRLTLPQLVDPSDRRAPGTTASLRKLRPLLMAVKLLVSSATEGDGHQMGATRNPTIRSSKSPAGTD